MRLSGLQRECVDWFLGSYWVERFETLDETTKVSILIPSVAAKFKPLFFNATGDPLGVSEVVDKIVLHARVTR